MRRQVFFHLDLLLSVHSFQGLRDNDRDSDDNYWVSLFIFSLHFFVFLFIMYAYTYFESYSERATICFFLHK